MHRCHTFLEGIGCRSLARLTLSIFLCLASTAHGQCMYEVELIAAPLCTSGGIPLQPPTEAEDMSDTGIVVGRYRQCNEVGLYEAFMWSQATGFVTLPRPAGVTSARALAISDDGAIIVGQMTVPAAGQMVAFVYQHGQMNPLLPLPGDHWSTPSGVTDDGLVVGFSENVQVGPRTAVMWRDGKIEILPEPNDMDSAARAVNASEQIAGEFGFVGIDASAVRWSAEMFEFLPLNAEIVASSARAINESGRVGGNVNIPEDGSQFPPSHPAVWSDDELAVLPILPECFVGGVWDIADTKVSAGICAVPAGSVGRATIWFEGEIVNLNDRIDDPRILILKNAVALDNHGRIAVDLLALIDDISMSVAGRLIPVDSSPTDLNKDCMTDTSDLVLLLGEWDQSDSFADVDDNGIVNVFDLLELLAGWGS